jgi:hypothetical protein
MASLINLLKGGVKRQSLHRRSSSKSSGGRNNTGSFDEDDPSRPPEDADGTECEAYDLMEIVYQKISIDDWSEKGSELVRKLLQSEHMNRQRRGKKICISYTQSISHTSHHIIIHV